MNKLSLNRKMLLAVFLTSILGTHLLAQNTEIVNNSDTAWFFIMENSGGGTPFHVVENFWSESDRMKINPGQTIKFNVTDLNKETKLHLTNENMFGIPGFKKKLDWNEITSGLTYTFKPGKTLFVQIKDKKGTVSPQRAAKRYFWKKTPTGHSLENNVTQEDIKAVEWKTVPEIPV